ncbi:MAG TPA: BON domain-containing protein [Abditibacteriaceae bacterium]|jgi:hyperosmotically inducible protein
MKAQQSYFAVLACVLFGGFLSGCTQAEQQTAAATTEKGLNEAGQAAANALDQTTRVVSDVSITGTIKGKILATKSLPASTIDVTTKNNIVTLTGSVQTAQQKQLAGEVAQNSPGVKKIINQLKVQK